MELVGREVAMRRVTSSPTATNETTPKTAFPRRYSHSTSRFYSVVRKGLRSGLKTHARHLFDSIPNPRTGAPQRVSQRIIPNPRVDESPNATEDCAPLKARAVSLRFATISTVNVR
jgi:hypothetical protein